MSTSARIIKQVTLATAVGVAVLAAPAAHAEGASASPGVHVDPHLRYSVVGTTVTFTPYLTGTQHAMHTPEGKVMASRLPMSFSLSAPAAAKWVSGNAGGDSGEVECSNTGVVAMNSQSLSPVPIVVKFPGPGTYAVTLSASVCTPKGEVAKTVNVTIPAAGAGTAATGTAANGAPKEAIAKEAAAAKAGKSGRVAPQGIPAAPGEKEAKARAAAGSAPAVGPHVETDRQAQGSDSTMLWGLAGLATLGAAGGAGVLRARRRG